MATMAAFPAVTLHGGRGLHSFTFRLNVSTFYGTHWVHAFCPSLLDRGTRGGVAKTAQVELRRGRVLATARGRGARRAAHAAPG